MIMKRCKKLFTFVLLLLSTSVKAQDVIVLKNNSTILSKVIEVTPESIKYKKASNIEGPTYTLPIADVSAINYKNGDKDTFSEINSQNASLQNSSRNKLVQSDDILFNDALISKYNDGDVRITAKNINKPAKYLYRILKVHQNSNMVNSDGKAYFDIKSDILEAKLYVYVENTTDEMMYLDLENCTFRINKTASSYFVNSSTTTSTGNNKGTNVNLGQVAGTLGIGGVIGSLASAVEVNGGSSSGTSTTIYSKRIITIPPHSTYSLPMKMFYDILTEIPYKTDFIVGQTYKYEQPKSLNDAPWEIVMSYVKESDLDSLKKYIIGIYISDEIPVRSTSKEQFQYNGPNIPLHYLYSVRK